jgi:hypothetical protein
VFDFEVYTDKDKTKDRLVGLLGSEKTRNSKKKVSLEN